MEDEVKGKRRVPNVLARTQATNSGGVTAGCPREEEKEEGVGPAMIRSGLCFVRRVRATIAAAVETFADSTLSIGAVGVLHQSRKDRQRPEYHSYNPMHNPSTWLDVGEIQIFGYER